MISGSDSILDSQYQKGVHLCQSGIKKVPSKYVLLVSERPNVEGMGKKRDIINVDLPTIDLAELQGSNRSKVVQSRAKACEEYGFFQIGKYLTPSEADLESQSPTAISTTNNQSKEGWSKTIATFAFSAALAIFGVSFQIRKPIQVPISFDILCIIIALAFSFSVFSILMCPTYPSIAKLLEKIAIGFGVLTFFIILALILPPKITYPMTAILFLVSLALIFLIIKHPSRTTGADEEAGKMHKTFGREYVGELREPNSIG